MSTDLDEALEGLTTTDQLAELAEKLNDHTPAVAETLLALCTVIGTLDEDCLVAFAEQSLDLSRTNIAITMAVIAETANLLGGLYESIEMNEWLGDHEALTTASAAFTALGEALEGLARDIRPARARN